MLRFRFWRWEGGEKIERTNGQTHPVLDFNIDLLTLGNQGLNRNFSGFCQYYFAHLLLCFLTSLNFSINFSAQVCCLLESLDAIFDMNLIDKIHGSCLCLTFSKNPNDFFQPDLEALTFLTRFVFKRIFGLNLFSNLNPISCYKWVTDSKPFFKLDDIQVGLRPPI